MHQYNFHFLVAYLGFLKKLMKIINFLLQEVCSQIWATLYDYPGLKSCDGLIKYIKECVRTAWGLTNQVSRKCHEKL